MIHRDTNIKSLCGLLASCELVFNAAKHKHGCAYCFVEIRVDLATYLSLNSFKYNAALNVENVQNYYL
jgi:hypothetical protein